MAGEYVVPEETEWNWVTKAVRRFEQSAEGVLPGPEDYRVGGDTSVSVRVLGVPVPAHLNYWPAQFVGWKPGTLYSGGPVSGGSGGDAFGCDDFYAEHSFQDCWLVLDRREFTVPRDEDLIGAVVAGKLVGKSTDDERPIVLRSRLGCNPPTSGSGSGGSGSGGSGSGCAGTRTYMTRMTCLPTGGFRLFWEREDKATCAITSWFEDIGCCGCGGSTPAGSTPGGSGGGATTGGVASCCGRALAATLSLDLSNGVTVTLTWDGSAYWKGSAALAGGTVYFWFDPSGCALSYNSANTLPAIGATCLGGATGCVTTCGPPFSKTNFRVQSALLGGAYTFGNLTGTVRE